MQGGQFDTLFGKKMPHCNNYYVACQQNRPPPSLPRTSLDSVPSLWESRDSSVGIANGYGLDGPGIESRWGRDFPHPSRPALKPTQPPVQWVPGLSQGVKRPGRSADHPPPSSAEVKERVELYLYSTSGSSWPVLG